MVEDGEWHRVKTNVHRAMISYKDQYDSHASGLIQEAIQNAVDAKDEDIPWKKWKFIIKYDKKNRILHLRDYGTIGMAHCEKCHWGELPDNKECTDRKCPWGVFHSFAFLSKSGGQLGSRGQGKSLAIVAGEETIVRTMNKKDSEMKMASKWTFLGEDWVWRLAPDESPDMDWPIGTEIEIRSVKDDVHNQLLDKETIISDIQSTWYPILRRGGVIRFGYSHEKTLKTIPDLIFPKEAIDPKTNKKMIRKRPRIEIKYKGEVPGELHELGISLAEGPMKENDPRMGIALIKNGHQVITRLTRFSGKIPIDIQMSVFGEVIIPCTKEKPFLEEAETPDHRGYKTSDPLFIQVKTAINKQISDLVEPFLMRQEKRVIKEVDKKRARQALEVIQKALDTIPELKIFGGGEVPPPIEPQIATQPYVSWIELNKKKYSYSDTVEIKSTIMNPTEKDQPYMRVDTELRDASLQVLATMTSSPLLRKGSSEKPSSRIINETIRLPEELEAGRYRILVKLYEVIPDELPELISTKGKWLWLETDPPEIKRPRKLKTGEEAPDYENNLRELWPVDDDMVPPEIEIYLNEEDATAWFNLRGIRLHPFWGKLSPAGSELPILYGLVSEELVSKYAEYHISEMDIESWPSSRVLSFTTEIEEIRRKFLHACTTIHIGHEVRK